MARKSLKDFLAVNGPRGGTNIALAVRALNGVAGAQECFLLTDGESGGDAEVLRLAAESKARGVPLHCIGVELRGATQDFMRRAASAGGGECSCVDGAKLATTGVGEPA